MSGPAIWKFGGTSVGDADRIARVAGIIAEADSPPVVVLSAPGGVTEKLWRVAEAGVVEAAVAKRGDSGGDVGRTDVGAATPAAASLHRELVELASEVGGTSLADEMDTLVSERLRSLPDAHSALEADARDALLSLGEDVAVRLVAAALEAHGLDVERVDAREVIRTDGHFGAAEPDPDAIRAAVRTRLPEVIDAGRVPLVQGFVGADSEGRTTTLGRGGSDLTATLLGSALESSAVHIWTDVDGILSGDPRWVDRPHTLDVVGFEEAVELAWFGARVLHAGAAKHAVAHRLPVRIRSTFAPERPGTLVLADRWGGPDIAAVACKRSVALIQVRSRPSAMEYGFLASVFGRLAEHRTPVDLVATSHTSTSFTVHTDTELAPVAEALGEVAEVEIRRGLSTVTVVGRGLLQEPGFAARVFQTVAFTPVHLISQATDSSLSFLVDDAEAEELVRRLHLVLIEGRTARAPAATGDRPSIGIGENE